MIGELIWCACISLEIVLLLRSIPFLFRRFPIFYSYIACVLIQDLIAIPIYRNLPGAYATFYWTSTILMAILGYLLILEIYGRSLEKFAGAARLVRIVLLVAFFLVVARALIALFGGSPARLAPFAAFLERDLRTLQAILLAALLGIFTFYRIPTGRNLRGIMAGYTLYVGVRVLELTAYTELGRADALFVSKLEPFSYLICLGIWTTALWSRSSEPDVETAPHVERGGEQLAGVTRSKLLRARAYLARIVRS